MNMTRNGGVAYGAEGGTQLIEGGVEMIDGGVPNGGMPSGTHPF